MLFVIRKGKKSSELEAFYIENEPEKLSQIQNLKAERIFRLIMRGTRLFKVLEGSNYQNPKEIEKMLKAARIVLTSDVAEWEEYFRVRLQNKRIEKAELCRLCLLNGKITVLTEGNRIKYHHEFICENCAEEELKNELRYRFRSLGMFEQAKNFLRDLKI